MSSFYIENLYNIIHTENITIIYTYAKNLPKSHEFEAVEGKNGYTQRFYQQSLDARLALDMHLASTTLQEVKFLLTYTENLFGRKE